MAPCGTRPSQPASGRLLHSKPSWPPKLDNMSRQNPTMPLSSGGGASEALAAAWCGPYRTGRPRCGPRAPGACSSPAASQTLHGDYCEHLLLCGFWAWRWCGCVALACVSSCTAGGLGIIHSWFLLLLGCDMHVTVSSAACPLLGQPACQCCAVAVGLAAAC